MRSQTEFQERAFPNEGSPIHAEPGHLEPVWPMLSHGGEHATASGFSRGGEVRLFSRSLFRSQNHNSASL